MSDLDKNWDRHIGFHGPDEPGQPDDEWMDDGTPLSIYDEPAVDGSEQ